MWTPPLWKLAGLVGAGASLFGVFLAIALYNPYIFSAKTIPLLEKNQKPLTPYANGFSALASSSHASSTPASSAPASSIPASSNPLSAASKSAQPLPLAATPSKKLEVPYPPLLSLEVRQQAANQAMKAAPPLPTALELADVQEKIPLEMRRKNIQEPEENREGTLSHMQIAKPAPSVTSKALRHMPAQKKLSARDDQGDANRDQGIKPPSELLQTHRPIAGVRMIYGTSSSARVIGASRIILVTFRKNK